MLAIRLETPNPAASGAGTSNLIDATDASYGLSTSGAAASNAIALVAANAAAVSAGKTLWIPKGSYSTTGVTFTARVYCDTGAIFVASTGTLAFNGGVDWDISPHLTLTGTALATFNDNKTLVGYAEWWGAVTDDVSVDNTAYLNAALVALLKTQLLGATYYTASKVLLNVDNHCLLGAGGYRDTYLKTAIACSSSTSTILELNARLMTVRDFLVIRTVAPDKLSLCVGINILTGGQSDIKNVTSSESMIGWKIHGVGLGYISRCIAQRSLVGTGSGIDTFKGFWLDGTPRALGGNASLYLTQTAATANAPFSGTSVGYYADKAFVDQFLTSVETGTCTTGIEIVGNNSTTFGYQNGDFHVTDGVFDACSGTAIKISDTDIAGNIVFHGGQASQSGAIATPLVSISNNRAALTLRDIQLIAGNSSSEVISISSSRNVTTENQIIEGTGKSVFLSAATNCSINDRVVNNSVVGDGVVLTNSSRNKLNVTMSGTKVGVGYLVTDALSGYNEFNCTGLDPSGITGGAANKLVINGTQVTAVGIAVAGHGTNVASGVMA